MKDDVLEELNLKEDHERKPVYIGTDPMKGTYKRDYEGDFLCTEEAVRAMFADQRDVSGDIEVLDEMGLDVLNQDTIKGYRIIFEQLHSGHPWNALENDEFLMKLRAGVKNKKGTLSPTIAGYKMSRPNAQKILYKNVQLIRLL